MNKNLLILLVPAVFFNASIAQIPKKRLAGNINVPTHSHIFPSLSGDGNQMIFLTDYTDGEGFEVKYTYKTGAETWADPEPVPSINRPGLDHIGSFCLSYDGNFVVFSSRRTPSIGNYDIWISEKKGKYWSQPKNPGKPLNSTTNEGNPSMSPDGKSIYFMRCESMDNTQKSNCRIFVSHRLSSTRWSEPQALPDDINLNHETTPRIMADNKTLIFASGKAGGKGKLDLYSTTKENGTWTSPKALSFLNTSENDEFVSVPARGDIIYFTGTYRDRFNIYKAIIPQEYRPEKVLMLTGKVTYDDGQNPHEDVLVQAFDVATGEVYTTTKLNRNDNSYTIFLPEGASYDVSAFPQKGGHTYASKMFDLEQMLISRKEEYPIELTSLRRGSILPLSTIHFENYTSELSDRSDIEIKRIVGFLKKNPGTRIEIGTYIDTVYTDTIPSNDLTEIIADTLYRQLGKRNVASDKVDFHPETEDSISEITHGVLIENNSTQTAGHGGSVASPADSILSTGYRLFEETDSTISYMKVSYTYHNNRTQKQAEAVMNKLIAAGVPSHLLKAKGYGSDWVVDRATEERNYWIELKILE